MATPRAVSRAMAVLFGSGGSLAWLTTVVTGAPEQGLGAIRLLASGALVIAALLVVVGARWPRWAFHAVLLCAWAMITCATVAVGGGGASLTYCMVYLLVVVNAFSAASWVAASAHLLLSTATMVTLLASLPGNYLPSTLMVTGLMITVCFYIGRLVRAASAAELDFLTGLVNRRGLDRHLELALARCARGGSVLSVAVIDLDHFKRVNDVGGHAAGDALLQQVAERWRAALPPDVLLARTGGDEFVLVAEGTAASLARVADRLREALPPTAGCSVGVAGYRHGTSASTLLSEADAALYVVKRDVRGRTRVAGPAGSRAA